MSRYCKDCAYYRESERKCERDGWQTSPYLTCQWQEPVDKNAQRVAENTDRVYHDVAEELRYGN